MSDYDSVLPKEAGPARGKVMRVTTHRQLAAGRKKIIAALAAHPDLLPLLAVNPVLAFRDAGVELSPEMADHVLRSVQYPPDVRAEKDRLVAELREHFGQLPRPLDPGWVASTLFERWHLAPLDTSNAVAAYHNAIPDDALQRLQELLPKKITITSTGPSAPLVKFPQSPLRLDLSAAVPDIPAAASAPTQVTLTDLWYYRGAHPLVTPLLRLGIIEAGAIPIATPDAYRKAKSGERQNQIFRWVTNVQFQPNGTGPPVGPPP